MSTKINITDVAGVLAGTTKFEMFNFVLGNQHSIKRVIIQAGLEYRTRKSNEAGHARKIRRKNLELQKLDIEIENTVNELDLAILKLDREDIVAKIEVISEVIANLHRECGYIEEYVDTKLAINLTTEQFLELTDEDNAYSLEEEYWVKRLSHQAALEISDRGNVATGNLKAITDLPQELQRKVSSEINLVISETREALQGPSEVTGTPLVPKS